MKTTQAVSLGSAEDTISNYVHSSLGGGPEPMAAFVFMGKTGAGKSTMIKLLGGKDSEGHEPDVDGGIESCTMKPISYEAQINSKKILLLDTPGFDDSERDNLEILREIVSYLYTFAIKPAEVQVRGIIFLHDIVEVRLGGSQKKTWQILNAICGSEGMKNVLVGTTQWSSEGSKKFQAEEKREKELCENHWSGIYKSTRVIYDDRDCAVRIINDLLDRPPVLLLVQQEMLRPPHTVEVTTAGQVAMPEAYAEMQRLEREMQEKQRQNEEEARKREEAHRREQEEIKRQFEIERKKEEEAQRKKEEEERQAQALREEMRRIEEAEQLKRYEEERRREAEEVQRRIQEEAERRHEAEMARIWQERERWETEQRIHRENMKREEEERNRQWAEENRRRQEEARLEQERIQREIEHANQMRYQEEQQRQYHHHHHRRRNDPCVIS